MTDDLAPLWLDPWVHPHGYCLANFDPWLVITSDLSNIGVAGAYMLGFPFAAVRLLPIVPASIRLVYIFGVLFVYLCGIGHFLDVLVTHKASYWLYSMVIVENVATAVVSWAFVLALLHATRHAGLRLVTPETASQAIDGRSSGR